MFGRVTGRFFIERDLGIKGDSTPDTVTLSELIETYPFWREVASQFPEQHKQLFTMFETSDVHPDIITEMKVFDRVIVPYDYLAEILKNKGINAIALNYYTSPLIEGKFPVIPKKKDPNRLIFLYVGTNDKRKNLTTLVKTFCETFEGTDHKLIVKTNHLQISSRNIKVITDKIPSKQLASLYNMCDYVISFTRGEGVGLPMLEANYFGKPILAHDQGVFRDVKKYVTVPWYVLPCKEVPVDLEGVPSFLHKVFYGSWWDVHITSSQLRNLAI
tara:strand:- start:463 stop:1281 length:819 start_codon:yes stop_codon:yes gene_type:complete